MAVLLCHFISTEVGPSLADATTRRHVQATSRLGRGAGQNRFITGMAWSPSACGRGQEGRGFPGEQLPLRPPQPGGKVSQPPKERAGCCGKQDATVPRLWLYPADKAALIPHLFLNISYAYTDVRGLAGSTYRHASTYLSLSLCLVHTYTHTCMRFMYVCMHACTY